MPKQRKLTRIGNKQRKPTRTINIMWDRRQYTLLNMFRNSLFHAHFWPDPFPAPENCNMVRTPEIPPMFLKHVAKNTQFFEMTAPYLQRGADHFLDRHVAWLQIMTVLSKFLQLKLRYGYVLFQVGEKSIIYRCGLCTLLLFAFLYFPRLLCSCRHQISSATVANFYCYLAQFGLVPFRFIKLFVLQNMCHMYHLLTK